MSGSLAGRIAVVTGGASGIGEACCRVLASRGARIIVADIDQESARRAAKAVDGTPMALDVGSAESCEAAAARCEAEIGPVDILVTSAGVIQRPLRPETLPLADVDRVVAIDQRGTYLSCLAFGRRMAARGRGAIVTIASIAGMRSMPLHAYAPAKAAVISMTECLAAEWGRSGVRVNCVSPGYTLTPALKAAIDKGERDVSALAANSALGRLVSPDEIAWAVAFLVSDEAAAISGVNLPVDAGWLVAPSWHTYGGVPPQRS
ncbi:MAG TPA: SDR family oxidoreductase [Alphaproteobacteria bacterium]|nr:SDR family oxidoreductase [Alphaproteobacteria bacterium]